MIERRPRVLVAEDEDFARERITRLVSERPDFELAAICRNSAEALAAFRAEAIDIALLDIEMPGISGLDLLRRIGATDTPAPLVVFITAHPRFAVDAFAGEAVDYVLKPFEGERLDQALRVARERLWSREAMQVNQRIRSIIDAPAAGGVTNPDAGSAVVPGRIVVRDRGRLLILHDTEIDWAEADGRYCVLNCGERHYRIDGPLALLANRLRGELFVQISRSVLINIERIRELQEMFKGDLIAVLKGGTEIPVSRRFRARVLRQLGGRV